MAVSLYMPLFVNPQDVIERMQLNADLDGITGVVSNAIMGAELHIQSLLNSSLMRKSQDCMYYLDGDAFSGIQPGNVFRLELPSSFVRSDTPVTITASNVSSWEAYGILSNGFDDSDGPFADFSTIDMTYARVDYDKGYVLLAANRYRNKYVRVQCDTGFEPGTNPLPTTGISAWNTTVTYNSGDQVVYNGIAWVASQSNTGVTPVAGSSVWSAATIPMEQIPQDLYEAILSYVPTIFDSSQNTNRNAQAQPQYQKASDHALMLLKNYLRLEGFTFRPLWK